LETDVGKELKTALDYSDKAGSTCSNALLALAYDY